MRSRSFDHSISRWLNPTVRQSGSFGMPEVCLADDPRLDRRVPIKLLPSPLAADFVAPERLRREAMAAAALDDPLSARSPRLLNTTAYCSESWDMSAVPCHTASHLAGRP